MEKRVDIVIGPGQEFSVLAQGGLMYTIKAISDRDRRKVNRRMQGLPDTPPTKEFSFLPKASVHAHWICPDCGLVMELVAMSQGDQALRCSNQMCAYHNCYFKLPKMQMEGYYSKDSE